MTQGVSPDVHKDLSHVRVQIQGARNVRYRRAHHRLAVRGGRRVSVLSRDGLCLSFFPTAVNCHPGLEEGSAA